MEDGDDREERIARLREAADNCTACALHATRTHVVFGEGNPRSPLAVVGEGPGETEDRLGRPFVGRAGALLDECLRACGITRKHVFITNVVRCRATLQSGGRTMNRAPTPDEMDACARRWLFPTLDTIAPRVILCVGGPSAATLIHPGFRILSERGRFHETSHGRTAIATLHPAYILRQQGAEFDRCRQLLIDDIEAARRKVVELRSAPPTTLFEA
ncbi:MAG: uracil-DNA glycosylase [Armatimonadota bacterium]